MQLTAFSVITTLNAILAALGAILVFRRRTASGRLLLVFMLLAVTAWSLGLAIEYSLVAIPHKIILAKLEYLGTVATPPLFFLFSIAYTRREHWLNRWMRIGLWVIPILTLGIVATNEHHHLHWTDYIPIGNNLLEYQHGPWFWIFTTYAYLLVAGGSAILISAAARYPAHYRNQMLTIMCAAVLPFTSIVVTIFDQGFYNHLNLHPITLAISGGIIAYGISRFESFVLLPVARDLLVENMADGVLVLDTEDRIVDINPTAQQLLGLSKKNLGQNASRALPAFSRLITHRGDTVPRRTETFLADGALRYFDIRLTPIYVHKKDFVGRIMVLRDVTEHREIQNKLERYARELVALNETTLEINSQPDLNTLLQAIVERATSLVESTSGSLYLLRPDGRSLELTIRYQRKSDTVPQNREIRLGEGYVGQAAQTGQITMADDTSLWEPGTPEEKNLRGERILAIPLIAGEKVIGVISLVDEEKAGIFTPEEIRLASLFADQAVIAIEKARLMDETHRRAEHLDILNQINAAITSGLNLDHVLRTLHQQCQQVAPADVFYVGLYDEKAGIVQIPVFYEGDYQASQMVDLRSQPTLTGHVLVSNQTVYVSDTTQKLPDPLPPPNHFGGVPVRSYLGLPLLLREKVSGVMSVQSYQPEAYSEDQIHLLENIAVQAAIAIENARLYAEVQRLAIVDELTGIYNYRGLLELGAREVERTRRFNRPLSAMFIDIDDFNTFNNRYSHATGNLVLQSVAQECRALLRSVDVLTRYGGDEFVILLPEANLTNAAKSAWRLCEKIAALKTRTEHGELGITISIGVAQYGPEMVDILALIDSANRAEHIAKERGDCVVVSDDHPHRKN
ncbi:MAG: GAF domain-containing protein [Anaerolineales bacterium]|nr:GAF domain-containing protein [Anaerolineales bacterium]